MLMMLAVRLPEFVQSLGRHATLLCVQRPGDGSVRNGIPADADDAPPAVIGSKCYLAVRSKSGDGSVRLNGIPADADDARPAVP